MKNIYNILTIYLILQTLHCKIGFFEPSKYTPTLTIIYTVYMLHNITRHWDKVSCTHKEDIPPYLPNKPILSHYNHFTPSKRLTTYL